MKQPIDYAREFVPTTPREHAMVKKCHLVMPYQEGVDQDSIRCPCESPNECHLMTEQLLRGINV